MRNTYKYSGKEGGSERSTVDPGRREFLRAFSGRRGREPQVEMPHQPAGNVGVTRRGFLKGAAALAVAAALPELSCHATDVDIATCEGTTVTERCSYENSAVSVCTVSVGNAVEKDGYLFKVKEINGTRVTVQILDRYLDCAEVKSVDVSVGAPQEMVELGFSRYGIAALEAAGNSVKLVVARDSGYMRCDGTVSTSTGLVNVGETITVGEVTARLDDVQRDTIGGNARCSAVITLLNSSGTEIGSLVLSEGESREFPYDGSRTYKIEVVEVARGDLLVSKWAVVSLSMCE